MDAGWHPLIRTKWAIKGPDKAKQPPVLRILLVLEWADAPTAGKAMISGPPSAPLLLPAVRRESSAHSSFLGSPHRASPSFFKAPFDEFGFPSAIKYADGLIGNAIPHGAFLLPYQSSFCYHFVRKVIHASRRLQSARLRLLFFFRQILINFAAAEFAKRSFPGYLRAPRCICWAFFFFFSLFH
jgi:hypothetical protein